METEMFSIIVNVQLTQLGYIPRSWRAIIRMEHTGLITTNCQVQYFRSFSVLCSNRTVWGCHCRY